MRRRKRYSYAMLSQKSTEDLGALLRRLLRDISAGVNNTPANDEAVRTILRILEEREPPPPLSPEYIAYCTEKWEEFLRTQGKA